MRKRSGAVAGGLGVLAVLLGSVAAPIATGNAASDPRSARVDTQAGEVGAQDLPGPQEDARFPVPVNLVIDSEREWDAHVAAAVADPQRFDGMVIGVVLDPEDPITAGGEAAREADQQALIALGLDPESLPTSRPPCAEDLAPPPPLGGFGTWLLCAGTGTGGAYFVPRPAPGLETGALTVEEGIALTLDELRKPLTPTEKALGYYSVLDGAPDIFRSAQLEVDGELTIALYPRVHNLGLEYTTTQADFTEQVARSAFSFPAVRSVRLTVQGSCAAFWSINTEVSPGCHVQTRDDLQERPS